MSNPWERQEKESTPAWQAWLTYRDLPASSRSIREVGQILGKSWKLVGRWSSRWQWVERLRRWDSAGEKTRFDAQQKAIARAAEKKAEELEVTRERTLDETASLAFSSLTEAASWNSQGLDLKDSETLSPEAAAAVQSVSVRYDKDGRPIQSIKMHEKMGALDKLGQHFKLWGKDDNPTDAGEFFLAFLRDLKNGKIDAALRERGFLPPEDEAVEVEAVPVAGSQPKFAPVEASEGEDEGADTQKPKFALMKDG